MQATTQQKLGALGVVAIAAAGIAWWNTTGQGAKITRYDVAKFLLGSIAVATALEIGTTQYQQHRKRQRESEVLELLGVTPRSGRRQFTGVSRIAAIDNSPVCHNCHSHEESGACNVGHDKPTEDAFNCLSFSARAHTSPRACTYKRPEHDMVNEKQRWRREQILQNPIVVRLTQNYQGIRGVDICPPWLDPDYEYNVAFGEAPYGHTNPNGLWTTYSTEDDWWNISSEEASVFAWEVGLAAAVTQSRESFEAFWADPEGFIAKYPNPNNHSIQVSVWASDETRWRFESCDN